MTERLGRLVPLLAAIAATAIACSSTELTCPADQRACSGACVALETDAHNCGACGRTCSTGQACSAGACVDCASNPAACQAAVAVACFNTDEVRFVASDLTAVGPPLAVGAGPIALAGAGGTFYVANSTSSEVTPFTLAPLAAGTAIPVTFPAGLGDLEALAEHGGLLWASNAAANTLVVVDPAQGKVVAELPLASTQGERTNPKSIAFVGTKAYLALSDAGAVAVLDVSRPTAPQVLNRIDVSRYATGPATASPGHLLASGSKLYVALANIIEPPPSFAQVPGAHGKLVTVDTGSDTVVGDALDLGPDCLDASALLLSGTTLWIGCGYPWGSGDPGAGILPVSIAGSTPAPGTIVKTSSSIDALAVCSGTGYAGAAESGTVLRFDVSTGAVTGTQAVCPTGRFGAFVPDLACVR